MGLLRGVYAKSEASGRSTPFRAKRSARNDRKGSHCEERSGCEERSKLISSYVLRITFHASCNTKLQSEIGIILPSAYRLMISGQSEEGHVEVRIVHRVCASVRNSIRLRGRKHTRRCSIGLPIHICWHLGDFS